MLVEVQRHLRRGEEQRIRQLRDLARAERLPLLATNGVLYATARAARRCSMFSPACAITRTSMPPAGCSARMTSGTSNPPRKWRELFRDLPEAITTPSRSRSGWNFSLENLGYEFPTSPCRRAKPKRAFCGSR